MGLEYMDTVFQMVQGSDLARYTIVGIKVLAVLFFLVNILKKYYEGAADTDGPSWGLHPNDLAKNFAIVVLVIFSDQVLGLFDNILVAIEAQYRGTAPALLPIQLQDIPLDEEVGGMEAAKKAMVLLYEALLTPLFGWKIVSFVVSLFLWILDLFIYPLFLAERYFLLGIMQAFFPLVISLAVFEKFRAMAHTYFRLYTAVYMLVPAFFLVNLFINALYGQINTHFWTGLFGTEVGSDFFAPVVELGSVGFIVLLKFRLYRKAISFTLRLFAQ